MEEEEEETFELLAPGASARATPASTPSGAQVTLTVPEGAGPGVTLSFAIPPSPAGSPERMPVLRGRSPPKPFGSAGGDGSAAPRCKLTQPPPGFDDVHYGSAETGGTEPGAEPRRSAEESEAQAQGAAGGTTADGGGAGSLALRMGSGQASRESAAAMDACDAAVASYVRGAGRALRLSGASPSNPPPLRRGECGRECGELRGAHAGHDEAARLGHRDGHVDDGLGERLVGGGRDRLPARVAVRIRHLHVEHGGAAGGGRHGGGHGGARRGRRGWLPRHRCRCRWRPRGRLVIGCLSHRAPSCHACSSAQQGRRRRHHLGHRGRR